jgi:hypothetical protein
MLLDAAPDESDEDLGYALGWFCAGLPIVGIGVMIFSFVKGKRRRAFQAIALPFTLLAYLACLLMIGQNWRRELDWLAQILWWGGLLGVPLLTVRILREIPWPSTSPART